jgi:hypothetical protein
MTGAPCRLHDALVALLRDEFADVKQDAFAEAAEIHRRNENEQSAMPGDTKAGLEAVKRLRDQISEAIEGEDSMAMDPEAFRRLSEKLAEVVKDEEPEAVFAALADQIRKVIPRMKAKIIVAKHGDPLALRY